MGVDVILTPFLPVVLVGMHITVSPSKSAPDNLSAIFLFIPTASIDVLPINFSAGL
jgi:hypothetical protein